MNILAAFMGTSLFGWLVIGAIVFGLAMIMGFDRYIHWLARSAGLISLTFTVFAIIVHYQGTKAELKKSQARQAVNSDQLGRLLTAAGFGSPTTVNVTDKRPLIADGNIKYSMVKAKNVEPSPEVTFAAYTVKSALGECRLTQYIYLAQKTDGKYLIVTFNDDKKPVKPDPASIIRLQGMVKTCPSEFERLRQINELTPPA